MIFSEETIVLIVSLVWLASEVVGGKIIPRLRQKGKTKGKIKGVADRSSKTIILSSILFSILISYLFGTNGITTLPELFFYVGIALMLFGIAFRQWAIWVLGRFFSTNVKILSGQKVVKDGPYSVIRHPSYSGALLILLGLGLASRTLAGTIIIIAISGVAYYYRITVEEKFLKAEFGKEYIEYAKKTKRLIPYLI